MGNGRRVSANRKGCEVLSPIPNGVAQKLSGHEMMVQWVTLGQYGIFQGACNPAKNI